MKWKEKPRKVSVIVDNDSWIMPYAEQLIASINESGDEAVLYRSYTDLREGFAAFFLGCINIAPENVLGRNKYNLVVHESDLPKGRGFAPVAWQILEGNNAIPICLIEAAENADTGNIYFRDEIQLRGDELNTEIRRVQGEATVKLCMKFIKSNIEPISYQQRGEATYYKKRNKLDSKLDIKKTIEEQFNLLRIVDNERYPAFFERNGCLYKIVIEKIND